MAAQRGEGIAPFGQIQRRVLHPVAPEGIGGGPAGVRDIRFDADPGDILHIADAQRAGFSGEIRRAVAADGKAGIGRREHA